MEAPHRTGGTCVRSDSILQILQEIENEARGPTSKPRPPQKDHMKENMRRLREMEAEARRKATEVGRPQPTKQRKHAAHAAESRNPPQAAPLRPCRSLPQLQGKKAPTETEEQKPGVPCPSRQSECSAGSGRSVADGRADPKSRLGAKHRPGILPHYLVERRREWEAERERERLEEEAPYIPEGHSLLPDEEREETLELLHKNRAELLSSLSSLPVRNDTLRLRRCREELERQLAKVEEGVRIFSKPKVLIRHQ